MVCKREVIGLPFDIFAACPYGFSELFGVQMYIGSSVYVAEESGEDIIRNSPWLGCAVADILYLQAHFLHHFPPDAVLKGFTDFGKPGHEREEGDAAVSGIFRQEEPVSVRDTDDDGGNDARVDDSSAAGADEGALGISGGGEIAAGSAVDVVAVPPGELKGSKGRINEVPGTEALFPERADREIRKIIRRGGLLLRKARQETVGLIEGEEVPDGCIFREIAVKRDRKMISAYLYGQIPAPEKKDVTVGAGNGVRTKLVEKPVISDILDHGTPLFIWRRHHPAASDLWARCRRTAKRFLVQKVSAESRSGKRGSHFKHRYCILYSDYLIK